MSYHETDDRPDQKTRRYIGMKSIMDIGMGIIYIAVGAFILFARTFNFENEFVDSTIGKIFAGLVIAYGIWRIYRGIKKDYLTER